MEPALGIECRADRGDILELMQPLHDDATAVCVRAERAVSRALSGNCQLPLGAYAQMEDDHVRLRGFVASQDGTKFVRAELTAAGDPEALGAELAARLRALGATEILAALQNQ